METEMSLETVSTDMSLSDLPDDVIVHVFRFLDYRWLTGCRLVNKRFCRLAESEILWKRLTKLDYGADKALWDCWTYRDFYSQVLHRFRYLPGWWIRNIDVVGGLLHVTIEKEGIICYECIPAVDARLYANKSHLGGVRILRQDEPIDPNELCARIVCPDVGNYSKLRKRRIFTISYIGRRLRIYCHQSEMALQDGIFHRTCIMCTGSSNHDCELICPTRNQQFIKKIDNGGFRFSCQDQMTHETMNTRYWLKMEYGLQAESHEALSQLLTSLMHSDMYYYRPNKFESLRSAASFTATPYRARGGEVRAERLPEDVILPRPGLYNGTYAGHGLELIECFFDTINNEPLFIGRKITGDLNVPAGETSFEAMLNCPLLLNQDEIASPYSLFHAVDAHREDSFALHDTVSFRNQPFFHGEPWQWDCPGVSLDRCSARFSGRGQIAHSGFTFPSFTPLVLSVHSENCFSLSWVELECIMVCFRCDTQPQSQQ